MGSDGAGIWFWGFLVLYAGVMYAVSPLARDPDGFFRGARADGAAVTRWSLTSSVFISWIFAKSVTNAANLGADYGIVGGLAYAAYWLSIPFAGLVIYRLRTRHGARGLVSFLSERFGRLAALSFAAAILVRLYNEVWSNTAVVGGYFGAPGESEFILAALLFTAATLFYSLKGGLRSSIFTDAIQAAVFVLFLGLVLAWVVPAHGMTTLLGTGSFRLDAGVDLLLVALLQILSYPFHDPVLTDRGFISRERDMLRAFVVAGLLGFLCILAFSLVGVHARLEGMVASANVPADVARGLGLGAFFLMSTVMIAAAGSTLDSTFSAVSKAVVHDLPAVAGRAIPRRAVTVGSLVMVAFAALGNLPMIAGTDILKATTVSGTMVMGLAPVFLLHRWAGRSPLAFHLSFWTGAALGVLLAAGRVPAAFAIGEGKYALLLGVNAYGLALCTALFLAPALVTRLRLGRRPAPGPG